MNNHKSEKIASLTKHLETIKRQMSSPSAKHCKSPGLLAGYRQWCEIEIKKTEQTILKLKEVV